MQTQQLNYIHTMKSTRKRIHQAVILSAIRSNNSTAFESQLTVNILNFIRAARDEGTVSMGLDNLRQCVKTPAHTLSGAPKGVQDYQELFASICNRNSVIKAFIL